MAHFLIVIAFDQGKVTCRLVQTILVFLIFYLMKLTCLTCVNFGVWDGAFMPALFLAVSLAFPLLLPIDGLGLLLHLLLLGSRFLRPNLRFVNSRVFHVVALSGSFGVVRSVAT